MLAIITDSTCDIPEDLIAKYGIIVVSQFIIWGEEQYRDRVDLQPDDFYQRLKKDSRRPTTSQAGVGDFLDAVNLAIEQGATQAVILTVSSAMSGTYNMATAAAEQAEIPVTVVDSKGPTMSLGWQVLAAARAREAGSELPEILEKIEAVRKNMVQIVAMESLEYLETGGRIGDAAKWMGTVLRVRPVIYIDHEKGVVAPAGLARTHKGGVKMLTKQFFDRLESDQGIRIAVLHGGVPDEAEKLAAQIRKDYDPVEMIINITGPVLGIHTGPGALALCGYSEG